MFIHVEIMKNRNNIPPMRPLGHFTAGKGYDGISILGIKISSPNLNIRAYLPLHSVLDCLREVNAFPR